jgi:hypothetical protein
MSDSSIRDPWSLQYAGMRADAKDMTDLCGVRAGIQKAGHRQRSFRLLIQYFFHLATPRDVR